MKIPDRQRDLFTYRFKAHREFFIFYLCFFVLLVNTVLADFDFEVGNGYSIMTQQYKVYQGDTLDAMEEDTLTFDNDFELIFDGKYTKKFGDSRIRERFYASPGVETFYAKNQIELKTKLLGLDIEIDDKIEYKSAWDDESSIRGYLKNRAFLEMEKKFKSPYSIETKFELENKTYNEDYSYSYDYSIFSGDLVFDFIEGGYIGYEFAQRFVPDSSAAEYSQNSVNLGYDYYSSTMSFGNYYGSIRLRDFSEELGGSYNKYYLDLKNRFGLHDRFGIEPSYMLESYDYETESSTYMDYTHHEIGLSGVMLLGESWEMGAGIEYLISISDSAYIGQSYQDVSIPFNANVFKIGAIWLDLSLSPGWRILDDDDADSDFNFYSDYFFVNIDAMATWWISDNLKTNLFAYYSPEWHDESSHDFKMSYLSVNLKYEF